MASIYAKMNLSGKQQQIEIDRCKSVIESMTKLLEQEPHNKILYKKVIEQTKQNLEYLLSLSLVVLSD